LLKPLRKPAPITKGLYGTLGFREREAMKVNVQKIGLEMMTFEVDANDPIMMLKCLIESVQPDLGPASGLHFTFKGMPLQDDDASLQDVGYCEGDVLTLAGGADEQSGDAPAPAAVVATDPAARERPGVAPTSGFAAVQIAVSMCNNEKSNGVYVPAVPYAGKPVWHKAGSAPEEANAGAEGEAPDADMEPTSKDVGERVIYYSVKSERWYIGDTLEEGGFSFVVGFGKSTIPPMRGWNNGTVVEFQLETPSGDINAKAGLEAVDKLQEITPWADQEICYVTMLKVLGNIAKNPGEPKFLSLKIDNAAIQNKILRFAGARDFLEALGFREEGGALVLPPSCVANATLGHEMLEGHATEASYHHIRKERHAKAAEEAKKEAAKPKRFAPSAADGGDSGPRFGRDRGPQRGGG